MSGPMEDGTLVGQKDQLLELRRRHEDCSTGRGELAAEPTRLGLGGGVDSMVGSLMSGTRAV